MTPADPRIVNNVSCVKRRMHQNAKRKVFLTFRCFGVEV